MRAVKVILWTAVALCGAFAYAVITRLIRPSEQVNALWLVVAAACTYLLAYRFYGAFLAAKVFALDDRRPTPAVTHADGRDFDATNKWVLFGHHFAAIAGAGPLIGPVLAAQFGYLPGALWILIGAVFAGAVQDFVVLVASVRHDGCSLAEIAKKEVGPVAAVSASIAILFIITVALAGLGLNVVNALAGSPWGTFTIGCTIPIALLMGFYLYHFRRGKVGEMTVIGVLLLAGAVVGGHAIAGSPLAGWFTLSHNKLVLAMAVYGFAASVLPVWMLLCPRDYLSTYMKIGTIGLLAAGILIVAPPLQMNAVNHFPRRRRPGAARRDFPVPVHHHRVRGGQRVPRAGRLRHDAEDGQPRIGDARDRLRGDAARGFRLDHGADRRVRADPGRLLCDHLDARRRRADEARLCAAADSGAFRHGRRERRPAALRRRRPGRGHGLGLREAAGHEAPDGLLVQLRADVRGALHSDDGGRRHARRRGS